MEYGDEDKQQRWKRAPGRKWDPQGTNKEHVIKADGVKPASNHHLHWSRLKQLRVSVQVHNPQRDKIGDKCPEEPRGPGPFFFFGGRNGASIVIPYCENRGWQRIYDKSREDYKLKWCEVKVPRSYYSFRAGEQLVFQIPNNKILTTKIGLLNSLRGYERVNGRVNHGQGTRRMKMEEFFPDTFRMDLKDEREAFFAQQEGLPAGQGSMWICKPTGLNQGRGIFLLWNLEDIMAFKAKIQNTMDSLQNRKNPIRMPQAQIVQRYIQNPLLLNGKKFDIRSYCIIACTSPYVVFFRHGYVRLTCDYYEPNSYNLSAHLTNQYMQKKNPLYSVLKEETVWSMERFNEYINETFMEAKCMPRDWVLGAFTKQMQQIMIQCFLAVKDKLECKLGYFDLIGCDFLIDENFKVWLLEMNCNPALHTNCEVLKEVVPSAVTETLDLVIEIFNKCRCGLKLLPLTSQRDFVLLYYGESLSKSFTKQRSRTAGPIRTTHTKSSTMPKKTSTATIAPNGDLANQRKESTYYSENMPNQCLPSVSANSSSNSVSISLSFKEPQQNNGVSASPNIMTNSEASAKHRLPSSVCPTHNTSSNLTSSAITSISCSQQLAGPQSKQVSGKMARNSLSVKPVEVKQSCLWLNKAIPNRVELQLSKCTWEQSGMTSNQRVPLEPIKAKSTITSLSSPSLAEESNPILGLRARTVQDALSLHLINPSVSDLAQSLLCQPLRPMKLETSTSTENTSPKKE
ncbi:protein polyglycylase TTLL10 [Hoplias malabaricus]|uniref:protein polyglycylase TTLL10 n=1 Tax=Hoplias malabaricus TaxID=27720 RepID=UPI0034630397